MSIRNVLSEMELKFLVLLFMFMCSFGSTSADTIGICSANKTEARTVTLELSLSYLTHYEGNCTCQLNRVNVAGNVTMDADIQVTGCDSISLHVERWDYEASCEEEPIYDPTQFLVKATRYNIIMRRRLGDSTPTIDGSIIFTSRNADYLVLTCLDAVYDIPPSTTTMLTTTMLTTTISAPSQLPTILGIAGGIVVGFIILLIIICLCIRYRQRRHRAHNAKLANKTGEIPDEDRERIDPEMTRYSWHKSIPLRLKRLYTGESRKKRTAARQSAKGLTQDRNAKGLSQIRNGDASTGTKARKTFQRLFRPKSFSLSSRIHSRENSTIEDDVRSSDVKDEEANEPVFDDVAAQHGGGIFMEARRTSCENLDQAGDDGTYAAVADGYPNVDGDYAGIEDGLAGVSVHHEDKRKKDDAHNETVAAEEELVASLFGDYDDVPDSANPKDAEVSFDEKYAKNGRRTSSGIDETSSTESTIVTKDEDANAAQHGDLHEADDGHISINGDVYSTVNKHKLDVSKIEHAKDIGDIDHTDVPDTGDDFYAVVDKSKFSKKQVSFFRT